MIIACPGCHRRYDVGGRKAGSRARCRCGTILRIPKVDASASTLSCPTCGAACSPEENRCNYCFATLAAVACPECFGRVFSGCLHCPHCGAEVLLPARADLDSTTSRPCPRCRESPHELVAHLLGQTLLDECNVCGGVWLDVATFEYLVKSRDEQAGFALSGGPHLTLESYSNASPDSGKPRYLPCPECGHLMNRKNFATTSGVIIDVCKPHGIWFDRDELGTIVQFVMKGGLETARHRELERLDQKLKNRREELAGWKTGSVSIPTDVTWFDDLLGTLRTFFV